MERSAVKNLGFHSLKFARYLDLCQLFEQLNLNKFLSKLALFGFVLNNVRC